MIAQTPFLAGQEKLSGSRSGACSQAIGQIVTSSRSACGCARLMPGFSLGDLAGGLAVAPARRSWGSGLSIAVQHNHGRTCIRTSRSSLRGIAAEDLCRSTHSLVSVTACLTRRRGDRFDLEQKIRLDQFRHDEQHRRRSRIAQKSPAHLDVSRNIVGAQ